MTFFDAFVVRHDTCADKTQYGTNTQVQAVELTSPNGAPDCDESYVWVWQSSYGGNNKNDQLENVSVSPDGSYVIVFGVKEGASPHEYHRWLVKFDAATDASMGNYYALY